MDFTLMQNREANTENSLNNEQLEQVVGGWQQISYYTFDAWDVFTDGTGKYFAVLQPLSNVTDDHDVICDQYDTDHNGQIYFIDHAVVKASLLASWTYIGGGKEFWCEYKTR